MTKPAASTWPISLAEWTQRALCMWLGCAGRRLAWPFSIDRIFSSSRRFMLLLVSIPLLFHQFFPGWQAVPLQIALKPEPFPPRLPLLGGALEMIDIAALFPQNMRPVPPIIPDRHPVPARSRISPLGPDGFQQAVAGKVFRFRNHSICPHEVASSINGLCGPGEGYSVTESNRRFHLERRLLCKASNHGLEAPSETFASNSSHI